MRAELLRYGDGWLNWPEPNMTSTKALVCRGLVEDQTRGDRRRFWLTQAGWVAFHLVKENDMLRKLGNLPQREGART